MWELSPARAAAQAPSPAPVRGLASHHVTTPKPTKQHEPNERPNALYYYYNVTISDISTNYTPCIFGKSRNFHTFS